jgi:biofilm PGA synthesis N-glycosyltransferase PgaC
MSERLFRLFLQVCSFLLKLGWELSETAYLDRWKAQIDARRRKARRIEPVLLHSRTDLPRCEVADRPGESKRVGTDEPQDECPSRSLRSELHQAAARAAIARRDGCGYKENVAAGPLTEPSSDKKAGRLEYALITPVRNEEQVLPRLAESIFAQTVLPKRWVIVDTGSTDATQEIVSGLAARADWIVSTSIAEAQVARGGPIVRAFAHGLSFVPPADIVVKFDADITADPTFFEGLLERFAHDEKLGIAGGALHELESGQWRPQFGTDDFVRGACRAYRWECLQDVLPLEERIGWDGVDLVKARISGWSSKQFKDLPIFHHRSVGQRERSQARSWYAMGDAMHYMGYRTYYTFVAGIFNARQDVHALMSILGFASAALRRKPRHPDPRVIAYVRKQQRMRMLPRRIAEKLGRA